MPEKNISLPITGMSCANCALNIERNIKKLQGVKETNVNFATDHADVTYDSSEIGIGGLIEKIHDSGYGVISIKGKTVRLHRFVYEMCNGPIPEGLVVRHSCDTRNCIAPGHLLVGTYQDNSQDMVDRDRQAKGAKNARCKISEDIVRAIRFERKNGASFRFLAKKFDLSVMQIYRISKKERWRHIK